MTFTIKKVSNYGTTHPFVARLKVQTHELLQWAALSKEDTQQVLQIYFELADRYIKFHEAHLRIQEAIESAIADLKPPRDSRVVEVPHAVGIEGEVGTFLYEAKNYLRDLTKVLNVFFGTRFEAARNFYDATGKTMGLIPEWAEKSFGSNDHFSQMLAAEIGWIGNLIKSRNAVEHPGGKSGVLHIENIKPTSDGKYLLPGWYRNQDEPKNLIGDLETISDNLLTLAEDVLVSCIMHKSKSPIIQFNQIPIGERNADCPIRLIAQIDHSKLKPSS